MSWESLSIFILKDDEKDFITVTNWSSRPKMFPSSSGATKSVFFSTLFLFSGSPSSPDSGAESWVWTGCPLIGSQSDGVGTT